MIDWKEHRIIALNTMKGMKGKIALEYTFAGNYNLRNIPDIR